MATYSSHRLIMGKVDIDNFCQVIGIFDFLFTEMFIELGPVVQSIVSLTTSLRLNHVKYMPTALSNTLLFFVGKM